LATFIAMSAGRAEESPEASQSDLPGDVPFVVKTRCTVATTPQSSDLRMAGAATWFAYAHAADRIDEVADELEEINRGEDATALRAVSLQLRRDMQKLDAETLLHQTEESFTSGGIRLFR
jgi:hypothetical protein